MSEERGPEEPLSGEPEDPMESEAQTEDTPEESMESQAPSGDAQMNSESEAGDIGIDSPDSTPKSEDAPEGQLGVETETGDEQFGGELAPEERAEIDSSERQGCGYFLKRGLRWAVLVLVIFTIGIVAMQIVRVQPLINNRNRLNQSISEIEAAQQALQVELDRLEGVDEENQALSESVQQAEARLALLNILVDVTRAQLALAQEDTVRVAAALQGTGEKLSLLGDLVDPSELNGLRERLVLVLSEVDEDPFAGERDLEILANTLLEIEQELAGE